MGEMAVNMKHCYEQFMDLMKKAGEIDACEQFETK